MGFQFSFNSAFVLTTLLLLSSAHGIRRGMIEAYDGAEYANLPLMEKGGETRKMMELDYADAGANTNTKSGFLFPPPPIAPSPEP